MPRGGTLAQFGQLIRATVLDKKVPNIGYRRALGTGLLMLLAVQAASGMVLSLFYAPTPDHAYDSIRYIDEDLGGGQLLRGLHHYGASSVIVLMVAHMLRVFLSAAYKAPRQGLWLVGLAIAGTILGFGFTGYLLPWDQKGYWATQVGLSIAETVPVVGPISADVLRGGAEIGALTLTRLYAMHIVILPAILLGLVATHLFLVHRLGITPPGTPVGAEEQKTESFFPDHVFRECVVGFAAFAVTVVLAATLGPPLEAPASASDAGYIPKPDWYFLGLYQLLKYFEGSAAIIGTVIIPGALVLGLVLMPWLDRNPSRRLQERPIAVGLCLVVVTATLILTVLGALSPGSKSQPPERVRTVEDGYVPPPSPPFRQDVDDEGAAKSQANSGLAVLQDYECLMCHTLNGQGDEMGTGAPELTSSVGERDLNELLGFLRDPTAEYPDTEMPSVEDLGMSSEELDALAKYLLQVQN